MNLNTLEIAQKDLFTNKDELQKTYTPLVVERILRIRDMYNWLLSYPESKDRQFIDDFCSYYTYHQCKRIIFYYDSTALGANYAVNTQDFRWVIIHEFEKRGWEVNDVYLGNPMRHDEKYLLINQAFKGNQRLMPFFNRQNNDDLILAIQTAGVARDRNGFHKNKGGEKQPETEENLLEHRTDGTDAFDTLYIGCEKFPQTFDESFNYGGVN